MASNENNDSPTASVVHLCDALEWHLPKSGNKLRRKDGQHIRAISEAAAVVVSELKPEVGLEGVVQSVQSPVQQVDSAVRIAALKQLMPALEIVVPEGQEDAYYMPVLIATMSLAGLQPDQMLDGPGMDVLTGEEVQVKLPHCVPEGFKTVADDLLKNLLTCYEYLRGRMNQQQAGLQAARDGNPDSMSAVNN